MENKNGVYVVLPIAGNGFALSHPHICLQFLVAELQGMQCTSAAQTSGEREVWDVVVSRPKMNDTPVVLHFGRGPKVQSELVWWDLAPLVVSIYIQG